MIERSFSAESGAQGFRFDSGTVPGLIGFDLGWASSDHHVSWLAVGPNNSAPLASGDCWAVLRDRDSRGHRITGTVKFQDLRELAEHRQVGQRGLRGEQRLRIPHLTSSEAFVLTGFLFAYEASDHNLLRIKLRQMAHNDHIYVNFGDNDGVEPYWVWISYAVIPVSLLAHNILQARSDAFARGETRVSRVPGIALLQSFEFRFQNGDHHVQRIGLDLDDDQVLVRFRDQDGNDPFSWMAEFAILG